MTAVSVKNVSKLYRLYDSNIDRLKESLSVSKKSYHKDFFALENVSFEISKGDVVGIIGRNGSGKSTILKIITGVLTPTSGSVHVKGKITALLELGAGFNPNLTGMENLYLNARISGLSDKNIEAKIDDIINFAEIDDFINQPLKSYSSGMKARLGFALAINIDPEILIIDEALSVGDAAFSRKCFAKIEDMCLNSRVTVLFVSHSESAITQLCNKAILLHNGNKVIEGNAKDVVNQYNKMLKSKNVQIDQIRKDFNNLITASKDKKKDKLAENSFYSQDLISKSTVSTDRDGAIITDMSMKTIDGKKVNVLSRNNSYIFSYRVTFMKDCKNVKFGMFIKTKEGVKLGGKGIKLVDKNIFEIKKGAVYNVTWEFKNILSAGYYFLNCGVTSSDFDITTVLHRIYDAYMFKVLELKDGVNGIIDFNIKMNIEKLSE